MATASLDSYTRQDTVICHCLRVTESELLEALDRVEMQSVREIARHTGAGSGCTACHCKLKKYLLQQRLQKQDLMPPLPLPFGSADNSPSRLVG